MSNIIKGLYEGRDSWDSNMPGYQGDYGGAKNWGRRNKASDENDAIDARLRQQNAEIQKYNETGNFWLKLKDTQRHLPSGPFVGKQAANKAAIELLQKQPELKGNLVITAYGPDEQVNELSPQTLASYKKKAGADASTADKEGDVKRADKRFSGIVKATKKEFDNDAKGVSEESEKNPHTSAIGRALYRDLSKEKKASPAQVQRNKERWAQRQAEREQGVAEAGGGRKMYRFTDFDTWQQTAKEQGYELKTNLGPGNYQAYSPAGKRTGQWFKVPYSSGSLWGNAKADPPGWLYLTQRVAEDNEPEGQTVKNSLHTIIRVATHLEKQMGENEDFPEWVSEKVGSVKDQMVSIMDYEISDKEIQGVEEDWQKVNKSDKTDGMSPKAVKAYRRENPGSKLKTAVTTKPSKLKKGSKAAKRRKSFCARMSGMKKAHASAKTKRDPNSPINKALRRWNCESVEQLQELMMIAEQKVMELREAANSAQQAAIAISMKEKNQKPKNEGQIYSGGGNQSGVRKYEPKSTPNQDELDENLRTDNPCWKGYHPVGTKKKDGKTVPNCVPGKADESIEEEKQRLDPKCWSGYKKQGTKMKGDVRVNNCVPKESAIMKGLQTEGNDEEHQTGGSLGTPYPSTYEQETLPYRTKGQRRTQAIAFEDKEDK